MNLAYLTVIAVSYLAFASVFGFTFWQKRTRFAQALTISWIVQAARIEPLLMQALQRPVSEIEWAVSDLLFPVAVVCLFRGIGALLNRPFSARITLVYAATSGILVIAGHSFGERLVAAFTDLPPGSVRFWAVFLRQAGFFSLSAAAAAWLAWVLYRYWRTSGLPGALIASAGALPFAFGTAVVPLQWYFTYYPWQAHLFWFFQVLALSIGFLVLVLNQDHAALQATLDRLRTLRGLLPICAACKRIRDDEGYWREIEAYVKDHSEAEFSHGLCPECVNMLYPDFQAHKTEGQM